MPDSAFEQRMHQEWDHHGQSAEKFFATARDVLHALKAELCRFPRGPGWQLVLLSDAGQDVVLSYLRGARRVLKCGGILECQCNGQPKANGPSADTKRPDGWARGWLPTPSARLFGVGNAYTSDVVAPSAGPLSSASLWLENLSDDADLNNLEVQIAARLESLRARPCYIGAYRGNGPTQVNVCLPPETPTGARGRVVPPPRVPRLLSVTDGINILSGTRLETRSIKAQEEVGPSLCVDPGADPKVEVVRARRNGGRHAGVERAFAPVEIEIAE